MVQWSDSSLQETATVPNDIYGVTDSSLEVTATVADVIVDATDSSLEVTVTVPNAIWDVTDSSSAVVPHDEDIDFNKEIMVDDIIDNESDNGNKYHLKYKKVTVFLGVNEPHGENTLVHNETIPPDSWEFCITSIFIRRALKWNSFDPDIHCIGSYIIWKMVDTKKYNLSKELLPISNVNNAKDISGAKEVTDRGRKLLAKRNALGKEKKQ